MAEVCIYKLMILEPKQLIADIKHKMLEMLYAIEAARDSDLREEIKAAFGVRSVGHLIGELEDETEYGRMVLDRLALEVGEELFNRDV